MEGGRGGGGGGGGGGGWMSTQLLLLRRTLHQCNIHVLLDFIHPSLPWHAIEASLFSKRSTARRQPLATEMSVFLIAGDRT